MAPVETHVIVSPVALPSPPAPLDSMKQKSICTFGKASSFSTAFAFEACGSSFPRPKTQALHQGRKGKCVRQCWRRSCSVGISGVGRVRGARASPDSSSALVPPPPRGTSTPAAALVELVEPPCVIG